MAIAAEQSVPALVEVFDKPALALIQQDYFDRVYDELRREAGAIAIDLKTEKGRKAIASMAHKIARTKTAIDDAGKALNEEARKQINAVDAKRREAREKLDALKDEVRAPLTEWEEAEKARAERFAAVLTQARQAAVVGFAESADDVAGRCESLHLLRLGPEYDDAQRSAVDALIEQATETLQSAVARLRKEEADRAELERLRAEAAERERKEREAAEIVRVAAEHEAARKAEAERQARAEEQRKAELARAAEAARQEAERKAAEAHRREIEALAAEKARIEREAKAREDARLAAERAAEAERQRLAEEQAQRERNKAHRAKIMGEVKQAIMACNVPEDAARAVVLAILAGQVPHTTIAF
jgi:hypothetical protein